MSKPLLHFKAVDDVATTEAARELIGEYLRWIAHLAKENYDLSFDVDGMLDSDINDRSKFYPPDGRFYLVRYGGSYVGVGCLKRLAPGVAEIQRMYVRPHVRGIGAGRALALQLLDDARAIGYRVVRLESLKVLAPAHTLYRSLGFVEIPPYAENSMEDYQPATAMDRYRSSALFMQLRLDQAPERHNDVVEGREILVDQKQRELEQTALRRVRTKLDSIAAEEQDIRALNSGLSKLVIALLIIFLLLMLGFVFNGKSTRESVQNWPALKQPEGQAKK